MPADEISYIGHTLGKEGLKPDPQKVRAITEMTRPQNKEELQRFLGMVTYIAKFIPNFSQVSAPPQATTGERHRLALDRKSRQKFQLTEDLSNTITSPQVFRCQQTYQDLR